MLVGRVDSSMDSQVLKGSLQLFAFTFGPKYHQSLCFSYTPEKPTYGKPSSDAIICVSSLILLMSTSDLSRDPLIFCQLVRESQILRKPLLSRLADFLAATHRLVTQS